eukprot:1158309-Pelagomonas_calceolata.AAC.10
MKGMDLGGSKGATVARSLERHKTEPWRSYMQSAHSQFRFKAHAFHIERKSFCCPTASSPKNRGQQQRTGLSGMTAHGLPSADKHRDDKTASHMFKGLLGACVPWSSTFPTMTKIPGTNLHMRDGPT